VPGRLATILALLASLCLAPLAAIRAVYQERRRHRIAGHYDIDNPSNFKAWDAAARGMPGILRFTDTTRAHRYGLPELYGAAPKAARRP
jgi:hypothetical protein